MVKKLTAQSFWTKVKEYVWVTVAGIINAISMYTFVNPARLIAGGVSGLSSALSYIFEPLTGVPFDQLMSIIYFVLNIPLLISSLILLRGDFTFKTIWATIVCSAALAILANFPQLQFHDAKSARLIVIIFGGILIGYSMFIASEYNGSNGGTEIIAKIVAKYHPEIDLSKIILIVNLGINVVGSAIVMAVKHESPVVVIYSMMYVVIGTTCMGMFKRGFNHPQKFMIVTTEYEQLISEITTYFKRGCTYMDVETPQGAPSKKIVMAVVQHRQSTHLKQLIKRCDPHAFIFVKEVYDVFSRPTFNRSYKHK